MAVRYRSKGIIFGKEDILEADRIFNIFTQDFGRLEIRAKAIRKINSKLKSGADIFFLSEIEFIDGKNHKTLIDATPIDKFENIAPDFKRAETAAKIAEVMDSFLKGREKDEAAFILLKEVFERINSQALSKIDMAYYYFIWNFLASHGYGVQVKNCASCGLKLNPYSIYFSCKEGGAICKNCLAVDGSALKINSDAVKMLRIILDQEWPLFLRLKVAPDSMEIFKNMSQEAIFKFAPANV